MRRLGLVLLAVTWLAAASLRASTILYSDFGPGDSFQASTGTSWAVGGGNNSSNAIRFVNSSLNTYTLDQFRFADNWFAGTDTLNVGFWGGSPDLNTATLLESFTFAASVFQTAELFTATSVLHPRILPGGTYFITQSVPGAPGTIWGWQWNNQGVNGNWLAKFGNGPWFDEAAVTPVFDISATPTPVPEPASLTLFAIGALGLGVCRRRQQKVR
jgi:hypothetical protein